jgi:hypothetical protein
LHLEPNFLNRRVACQRCWLLVVAVTIVPSLGCMEGPFNGFGRLNPYIRKEWDADDAYASHYYIKRDKIAAQVKQAGQMTSDQQRKLAADTLQAMQDEKSPVLRAQMVQLLGNLNKTDTGEGIKAALQDSDEHVRVEACRALAKQPSSFAIEALSGVVSNDQNLDVRIEAVKQLGRFPKGPEVEKALAAALDDTDAGLQFAAVRSLETVTGKYFGVNAAKWREYLDGQDPPQPQRPMLSENIRDLWYF